MNKILAIILLCICTSFAVVTWGPATPSGTNWAQDQMVLTLESPVAMDSCNFTITTLAPAYLNIIVPGVMYNASNLSCSYVLPYNEHATANQYTIYGTGIVGGIQDSPANLDFYYESCGYVFDNVLLIHDFNASFNTCFTLSQTDTLFNCNGHPIASNMTLSGSAFDVIVDNNKISGCTINDYLTAVHGSMIRNLTVSNSYLYSNSSQYGIYISDSIDVNISNVVTNNFTSSAIYLLRADNFTINSVNSANDSETIHLNDANGGVITGVQIRNNSNIGIFSYNSHDTTFRNLDIEALLSGIGVSFYQSDYMTINDSSISTENIGLNLRQSTHNILHNIDQSTPSASLYGFVLEDSSDYNILNEITTTGNTEAGIFLNNTINSNLAVINSTYETTGVYSIGGNYLQISNSDNSNFAGFNHEKTGIAIENTGYVLISNVDILQTDVGLYIDGTTSSSIDYLNTGESFYGVMINNSDTTEFSHNIGVLDNNSMLIENSNEITITDSAFALILDTAIRLQGTNKVLLNNNSVQYSVDGIYLSGCADTYINNTIMQTISTGMYSEYGSILQIQNTSIDFANKDGIVFNTESSPYTSDSFINNTNGNGIFLINTFGASFVDTFISNATNGIATESSSGNYYDNVIVQNTTMGYFGDNDSGSTLWDSQFNNNGYGVVLTHLSNSINIIGGTQFSSNTQSAIWLNGTVSNSYIEADFNNNGYGVVFNGTSTQYNIINNSEFTFINTAGVYYSDSGMGNEVRNSRFITTNHYGVEVQTSGVSTNIKFSNVTMTNFAPIFVSPYISFDLNDTSNPTTHWAVAFEDTPTTIPSGLVSFHNKTLNFTNMGGTPESIFNQQWYWTQAEEQGFDYSAFDVYKYTPPSTYVGENGSLSGISRVINMGGMYANSTYTMLENYSEVHLYLDTSVTPGYNTHTHVYPITLRAYTVAPINACYFTFNNTVGGTQSVVGTITTYNMTQYCTAILNYSSHEFDVLYTTVQGFAMIGPNPINPTVVDQFYYEGCGNIRPGWHYNSNRALPQHATLNAPYIDCFTINGDINLTLRGDDTTDIKATDLSGNECGEGKTCLSNYTLFNIQNARTGIIRIDLQDGFSGTSINGFNNGTALFVNSDIDTFSVLGLQGALGQPTYRMIDSNVTLGDLPISLGINPNYDYYLHNSTLLAMEIFTMPGYNVYIDDSNSQFAFLDWASGILNIGANHITIGNMTQSSYLEPILITTDKNLISHTLLSDDFAGTSYYNYTWVDNTYNLNLDINDSFRVYGMTNNNGIGEGLYTNPLTVPYDYTQDLSILLEEVSLTNDSELVSDSEITASLSIVEFTNFYGNCEIMENSSGYYAIANGGNGENITSMLTFDETSTASIEMTSSGSPNEYNRPFTCKFSYNSIETTLTNINLDSAYAQYSIFIGSRKDGSNASQQIATVMQSSSISIFNFNMSDLYSAITSIHGPRILNNSTMYIDQTFTGEGYPIGDYAVASIDTSYLPEFSGKYAQLRLNATMKNSTNSVYLMKLPGYETNKNTIVNTGTVVKLVTLFEYLPYNIYNTVVITDDNHDSLSGMDLTEIESGTITQDDFNIYGIFKIKNLSNNFACGGSYPGSGDDDLMYLIAIDIDTNSSTGCNDSTKGLIGADIMFAYLEGWDGMQTQINDAVLEWNITLGDWGVVNTLDVHDVDCNANTVSVGVSKGGSPFPTFMGVAFMTMGKTSGLYDAVLNQPDFNNPDWVIYNTSSTSALATIGIVDVDGFSSYTLKDLINVTPPTPGNKTKYFQADWRTSNETETISESVIPEKTFVDLLKDKVAIFAIIVLVIVMMFIFLASRKQRS